MLNTLAPQKSVYMDFPDRTWAKPVDYPHNELPSKEHRIWMLNFKNLDYAKHFSEWGDGW